MNKIDKFVLKSNIEINELFIDRKGISNWEKI